MRPLSIIDTGSTRHVTMSGALRCLTCALCALQAKFEDKWNAVVVPKLIEAEVASRSDEAAVRLRLSESANARAGEALQGEAARLNGHFEALEARIAEAKSLAAAACQPMSSSAKVLPPSLCLHLLLRLCLAISPACSTPYQYLPAPQSLLVVCCFRILCCDCVLEAAICTIACICML